MSQKGMFSPIVIAALLVAGLLTYLYLPGESKAPKNKRPAPPVKLVAVSEQRIPIQVEALGTARANEALILTTQQSDIVNNILFDDGELVKKGQLLVQLTAKEEQARVTELEVNLKDARRQLKRVRELAAEKAASKQLLDEQQATVDSLIAQLDVAKAQLNDYEIRAPFSGVLGVRQISLGALVRPGDAITSLDDLSVIKLDFTIAEEHLPSLAKQQNITATSVAYPDQLFKGKISNIASRIDPVTRAVRVRALIDNPNMQLRPGMLLKITVEKRILAGKIVPEGALVPIGNKQFVYKVAADNKAQRVEVQIGERRPGIAHIAHGLEIGDRIVVEGALRLHDGAIVNPVEIPGDELSQGKLTTAQNQSKNEG